MFHDSQLINFEVSDHRNCLVCAKESNFAVVLGRDLLDHVLGLVIQFDTIEGILSLCGSNRAKELNFHWYKVRVLGQLDGLLPESGWHDQDILGWALEVDLKSDSLVRVKLEESDRFEVTERSRILHPLFFPSRIVLQLKVSEDVGNFEGLQSV